MTVTYALKDHPGLPAATRERIKEIARKMGYVPDPLFATLAQYRTRRPAAYHGTLAWLAWDSATDNSSQWRDSPHYVDYFQGASERAPLHGYKVEEHRFDVAHISPRRVADIFRSRGISGILLCPPFASDAAIRNFPWKDFSCVGFGYALRDPALHTVASAHFQNARAALRKLRERGFDRIGLVISRATDIRCNRFVSSAFLVDQLSEAGELRAPVPPLCHDFNLFLHSSSYDAYLGGIASYAKAHRLDAILTADYQLDGLSGLPPDLEVVGLSLPSPASHMAGIVEDSRRMGAVAVDQLVAMIQRGERGIPHTPLRIHVEGVWHDRKSPAARNQRRKIRSRKS